MTCDGGRAQDALEHLEWARSIATAHGMHDMLALVPPSLPY